MSLGELWRKLPSMAISEPSRYAFSLLRSSICKPNQWWQRCVITTADIRICRVRISFRMFFSKRFLFHQSTSIKVDVQVTVKHDFGRRRWRTIECVLKSLWAQPHISNWTSTALNGLLRSAPLAHCSIAPSFNAFNRVFNTKEGRWLLVQDVGPFFMISGWYLRRKRKIIRRKQIEWLIFPSCSFSMFLSKLI